MPDYANSKVYAIRSYQTDEVYIGSTTSSLSLRMTQHRHHYKRFKNGKYRHVTSFIMMEYNDVYIELLEKFPCLCLEELLRYEGQHIRSEENAVNKRIEGRTQKEYRQDNADHIKDYKHKYNQINKDKIKIKRQDNADKLNKKVNCSCGGKYTHTNKAAHFKTKLHQEYGEEQ